MLEKVPYHPLDAPVIELVQELGRANFDPVAVHPKLSQVNSKRPGNPLEQSEVWGRGGELLNWVSSRAKPQGQHDFLGQVSVLASHVFLERRRQLGRRATVGNGSEELDKHGVEQEVDNQITLHSEIGC